MLIAFVAVGAAGIAFLPIGLASGTDVARETATMIEGVRERGRGGEERVPPRQAQPSMSVGASVLERENEREAYLFDDCAGASTREGGFGGGEAGGEWSVVEDVGDPVGKVVAGAVVAQDTLVALGELVFQLGEVGGDGPGRGAGLSAEVELVGGLDAGLVVLVLMAQVRGRPGPCGEGRRLARVLSPGQHGAPGWPVEEAGDVGARHPGDRCGEVDERVAGAGRAEGEYGVEGGEGSG